MDEKEKAPDIDKQFWDKYFNSLGKEKIVKMNDNIIQNQLNHETDFLSNINITNQNSSEISNNSNYCYNKRLYINQAL